MKVSPEDPDDVLVSQAGKGNARAFEYLVKKYQHRVLALIGRYIRDSHEAQDVAQDAFVRAFKALPNFRGDAQFYTWLYRIAVNTAKNHLVSRGRRAPTTDIDIADAEQFDSADALRSHDSPEANDRRDRLELAVRKAIAELPEDLRVALTLRELEGKSYDEISAIMACPVGTVRSRIFRARDTVSAKIEPYMEGTFREGQGQ
ncbi:RNA polymerase sigma factor RpoE [Litorivicinus lipolyticus]|uniref:RNA polymerase sigma factor n=1 Tax=Litorivicinus lipolyticus TaxID=418701 RepID=A0A5Q2QG37_9GAMM|nr:RNA polymerase sigma factor RpoE [Litorivicinus lipolyticus]QGG81322.1 RNA polymerase sigma factor RpoE [Litorivicinus lipolyticus]